MPHKLFVMIPAFGRPQLLGRTLKSLAQCELPESYRGTLVIENGRKCGLDEVVRRADPRLRARYLYCAHPGRSAALNVGLEHAGNCLAYMTDDDIRFSPGVLCAYEQAARGIEGGCIFGGPLGIDYEAEPPEWLKAYLPRSAVGWRLEGELEPDESPIFLGANWAAFAGDLREAGGFNPDRGTGARTGATGQETDMHARLYDRGSRPVYVPDAMVWHYVPASRCSARWALDRMYRNGIGSGLDRVDHSSALFGYPRWMIREWLLKGLRTALAWICPDRLTRFQRRREFAHYSGLMTGRRLARKRHLDQNQQRQTA